MQEHHYRLGSGTHVTVAAETKMIFVDRLYGLAQQVVDALVCIRPVIGLAAGAALQARSRCRIGAVDEDEVTRRLVAHGKIAEALTVLPSEVCGIKDDDPSGSEAASGKTVAGVLHELVFIFAVGRSGNKHAPDPIRTDHRHGGLRGECASEVSLACPGETA